MSIQLTNKDVFKIVREQLAIDYNCLPEDFLRDGIIFTEAKKQDGRRELPFGNPRCELITMGHGIIVNASKELIPFLKYKFRNKSNYEIMNSSFIYGVNPYYLQNVENIKPVELNSEFSYRIIKNSEIYDFYKYGGLNNALQYNKESLRPERIGLVVFYDSKLAGIACASADCETMYQIGVDVLPEYRKQGVATAAVNMLTFEVLNRGIVPYYTTDCSNIPSQRAAISSGYYPAWSHSFKHRLIGKPFALINYLKY